MDQATTAGNRRVLIVGAGIAGATLAYWLKRHGFAPTLLERAPAFRTGGYMIDFWGVGYDVAERMGLIPALRRVGYQIHELRIVAATGRMVARLETTAFQSATRGRYASLLRGDLAACICDLIAGGVETVFGDSITAMVDNGSTVCVTFERTPPREFDLVVGADGLHSVVRTLMVGEGQGRETDLGYYTAAFTATDYPHRDEGAYVSFSAPGRQVARYALRDGRSTFFFVLTHPDRIPIGTGHEREQHTALRAAFQGMGWECDAILSRMDGATDFYFDIVAQMRLRTWSHGRTALVGDAAYCPSLLAGQGAALAMTGAYMLAHELATAGGDHASAFAAYEQGLKPFIDAKQRSAAGYRWWFAPRTAWGLWLRNHAMRILGRPGLGSLLIGRSLGDRFTLPESI